MYKRYWKTDLNRQKQILLKIWFRNKFEEKWTELKRPVGQHQVGQHMHCNCGSFKGEKRNGQRDYLKK